MRISPPHLSIERLRTLVLVSGVLLVLLIVGFLAFGRLKNRLNLKEVPKRLGANIQREANGFTYTQSRGGHTLFKIHATRVTQLKQDNRALLHEVQIELYAEDGHTVDRISGGDFQYDQEAGIATAAGPVEITIMRPGEAPAVAGEAHQQLPSKMPGALADAAHTAASGQIDVKTSGLTFNQKTGIATTAQKVEFAIVQGSGSSLGATFDSDKGQLILDRDVELKIRRAAEAILLRAEHGEFQRDALTCDLRGASASYRNGQATAGQAHIVFRQDGSATRLDARDGFTLTTATGTKVAAPTGSLDFNEKSQPTVGRLGGGVTMAADGSDRRVRGSAPRAQIAFASGGELKHAHLERGVTLHSEQQGQGGQHLVRDWTSPLADIDFRNTGGHLQIASVHGSGGVVITAQAQHAGGPVLPSRMAAETVTGEFGANQELTRITGSGHASLEQTTAAGVHQFTSGDRIEARLVPAEDQRARSANSMGQIQSATVDGNVVLAQTVPANTGQTAQSPLRATAGKLLYDGASEWLRLSENPRVNNGALQLSADKLDVAQLTGDALAHGNVKATWLQQGNSGQPSSLGLGGQGPAHVVAQEARLQRSANQATFRGHARLWQQANSISAPEIVLDQNRQTLVAHSSGAVQPVELVLLSAGGLVPAGGPKREASTSPSVIKVRAGDLKYSAAERKAVLHAGAGGPVVAESATATTLSNEIEILLLAPGNHAGLDGSSAQLDRLIARGHVVINLDGRRGSGEQLVYSSETGNYTLTGTAAAPPRITDPAHGSVTGEALIFNSRDDSVSIEGQGKKTVTQSTAPR